MSPISITIQVKPDGEVVSTVHGATGSICGKASEWVDQIGEVVKDEHTDDWYRSDEQGIEVTV